MANFTGQPISQSYQRVLQIDGGIIQDGLGNTINNATIGNLAGSLTITGSTNLYNSGSTVLSVNGAQGEIFSITDDPSDNLLVVQSSSLNIFSVFSSGSIILPNTQSTIPSWTGTDGEMVFATITGNYYFYVWMDGNWRSGSLL